MGVFKERRGIQAGAERRISSTAIQTIALTGVSTAAAGTAIRKGTQYALITGASTGTGAGWEVSITDGRPVGSEVTVVVECNSTVPVTVLLPTTAATLFGSTSNAVVFSTNSSGASVKLTKVAATQWALHGLSSLSTQARPSIAGSTGTV